MSNNTQGDSSTQLQSTIEVTTDQILKFPETPSDLLVTDQLSWQWLYWPCI
jgi:hypothetical protein